MELATVSTTLYRACSTTSGAIRGCEHSPRANVVGATLSVLTLRWVGGLKSTGARACMIVVEIESPSRLLEIDSPFDLLGTEILSGLLGTDSSFGLLGIESLFDFGWDREPLWILGIESPYKLLGAESPSGVPRTKAHISCSGLKARLELVVSGCGSGSRLLHDAHRIYGEPPEDEGWGREWIYKLALNTAKGKTPITTTETTPIAMAERRSVDKTATAPSENVLSRGAMSHPRRGGSIWRGR
ncbi:hypothetical protein GW17_00039025 [Ensete ventricosum]|nr:hypothetical protein GW17_00039025 [Ensete ventricosum]